MTALAIAAIVAAALFAFQVRAQQPARPSADWVRDAVIYEAYLRSFSSNSSFAELEARLPELKKLGVTVLWVMPIHPVGKEKRKGALGSPYAVQDYYAVNREFGTLDDFRSLVKATHDAGMKIIIDLVINHTAWDNELLKKHPEWYRHDKSGKIVFPANWEDVAHLDYSNAALRQYMLDMMLYWVRDVGIDGYRCDVAGMVPLDFWEAVRAELDKIKPVMMLAEDSKPEEHLKAFDLTYSWNVCDAMRQVIRDGKPAGRILDAIRDDQKKYPTGSLRLRFSSNHDHNAWDDAAINLYGPAGAKAAAVLSCTLPGVPLLYNGDEVGNAAKLPLFEKVDIEWQRDPLGMRKVYEELFALRRQYRALIDGEIEYLRAGNAVVAFVRQTEKERILVAVNVTGKEQRVKLEDDVVLPAFGYLIKPLK